MSILLSTASAAEVAGSSQGNPLTSLLFFGGFMALMYWILIRPQRQRQKEHQDLVAQLALGDEVLSAGGLTGKIVGIDESFIQLQIAENVNVKVQRTAIVKSFPKGTL